MPFKKPEIQYIVHKNPPLVHILIHTNSFHTIVYYILQMCLNIILPSAPRLPSSFKVFCQNFVNEMLTCMLQAPPTNATWFNKVKFFLCLTNWALRHEGVWGSGCIDSHFLDLGSSWRWVVSFSPLPLYPRYPLYSRLGGPQSRSGLRGEEKNSWPTGTRTPTPRSYSPHPVATPTTLSRLSYLI
jgi:hypothetical protein